MKNSKNTQRKRGVSNLLIYLAGAVMAIVAVAVIISVVSNSQDNTQESITQQKGVDGIARLASPDNCPGGIEAASIQNLISRGGSKGTQGYRYTHLYQISKDLNEAEWEADFTGDGDINDIVKGLPIEEVARNTDSNFASMLRRVTGGIVIKGGADFIRQADTNLFINGADAESLVLLGFYGSESLVSSSTDRIVLSYDFNALPNNVNSPGRINTSIPIPQGHGYSSFPDISFKAAVFVNPNRSCWYLKYTGDSNYISPDADSVREITIPAKTKQVSETTTISGTPFISENDLPCLRLSGTPAIDFGAVTSGMKTPRATFATTCVAAVSVKISIDFLDSGNTTTEQVEFDIPAKP